MLKYACKNINERPIYRLSNNALSLPEKIAAGHSEQENYSRKSHRQRMVRLVHFSVFSWQTEQIVFAEKGCYTIFI